MKVAVMIGLPLVLVFALFAAVNDVEEATDACLNRSLAYVPDESLVDESNARLFEVASRVLARTVVRELIRASGEPAYRIWFRCTFASDEELGRWLAR